MLSAKVSGWSGRGGALSIWGSLLLLLMASGPGGVDAQAPATDARGSALEGVPAALAPWVPWVRTLDEGATCPVRDGQTLCFWPSALTLALDAQGGSFRFDVRLDRRQLVRLPGGPGRWPSGVRVSGKALPVIAKGEVPALSLPVGEHRIEGRFSWARLPEQLPVPPEYGVVRASLDGRALAHPKRDESGQVWLQRRERAGGPEQLELIVTRKLEDAVPLRIESRIRIRAAGEPREINLGQVLVPGSVPLAIESELPVRLSPEGDLQLQVRAGSYGLRVLARTSGSVRELASRARPAPWPAQEAWVFQPDPALRQVRVEGAPAVDPARLELDADLRGLPTFVVAPDAKLTLEELRRGEPEPPPNQLTLERTLWLDQDGRGYTVHDRLSGELHSGFRLELHDGQLGRASQRDQDLLITQRTAAGPLGVELRDVQLALSADSRLDEHVSSLPAVGWSEDVRQLAITLNLPPGYALWAVSGVDQVDRSWLGDWNLLGLFFVLLVAFGTAGVAGRWAGLVAFLALALTYQEPDAPSSVWLWLLVSAALLRAVPQGTLWQLVRAGFAVALAVLVITGLPFATRSVREAIYPQLGSGPRAGDGAYFEPSIVAQSAPAEELADADDSVGGAVEELEAASEKAARPATPGRGGDYSAKRKRDANVASSYASGKQVRAEQDPDAVVQTGPGLPDWQFQRWQLRWSGPVAHDHRFELVLVPPLVNRLLSLLRVALCGLLAFWIVRSARPIRLPLPAASAGAAAACLVLCAAGPSSAQFPDAALLEQLRARSTRAPECRPDCVHVALLDVQVGPDGLTLRAEVHAQDRSSVRIAGPLALWVPEQVRLDGKEARVIAHPDGFLHVRVEPGVQQLEVFGALPATDTLTLRLGDTPTKVHVHSTGYEVSGVREDGETTGAIELRKLLRPSEPTVAASLPPWFSVARNFEFASEFRVHTRIERLTPLGSPQLLHLPLLPGEAVHDARVQVKDGSALVAFGPDDRSFEFDGALAQRAELTLVAAQHEVYSERWRFACGSMWQCTATGLPPVSHEADQRWQPEFRPWPGERLQIALQKPAAAKGQTTTIDGVTLTLRPGVRALDAALLMTLRTSRGGDHQLILPEGARVRSFSVAGARRVAQRAGAAYGFSVLPGRSEVDVAFELPTGYENLLRAPQVVLDGRARNVRVVIEQPADRWLLWVHGPAWGPAVLFWGYLLLALGVAYALGRLRSSPLRSWDWLLLAAGLTQTDPTAALCIVAFFFVLAWRARTLELAWWKHDLLQLVLVGWALAFAAALFDAVQSGLMVQPDMQVMGGGSHGNTLRWYVDDSAPELPTPSVLSLPIWTYRVLMLAWSLWLAKRLLTWAPWAFRAFAAGGLWKKRPGRSQPAAPPVANAPAE